MTILDKNTLAIIMIGTTHVIDMGERQDRRTMRQRSTAK